MKYDLELKFKRFSKQFDDIELPMYQTLGSSGMDIRAAIEDSNVIKSSEFAMIPTNLGVEIPQGFEIQVRSRSGLAAKHGVMVLNSPGTIDEDYRGEIKVILMNLGKEDFTIFRGDRIAQLVVSNVCRAKIEEVTEINETKRGEGGFGHTSVS